MKIDRQQIGSVEVFSPSGPLVEKDAAGFAHVLSERIRGANPRIVVSMGDVPYMDSAAIESLLDATDELSKQAMNLKLAGVTPTCREIFELTGISGRFSLFPDVQTAVRSFL